MADAVPTDCAAGAFVFSGCCTLRAVRLEFGPHPSGRELFDALGDALASSGLVANDLDLAAGSDGYVLRVSCEASDEGSGTLDALIRLLDRDDPQASSPPGGSAHPKRCSLVR